MRFEVPQFIDIESTLIGSLTFKQVVYLGGGIGIVVALYLFFRSIPIAVILGGPFLLLGSLLAFYKPNGKPFVHMLESMYYFFTRSRLYLWQHVAHQQKPTALAKEAAKPVTNKTLDQKTFNLDTGTEKQ